MKRPRDYITIDAHESSSFKFWKSLVWALLGNKIIHQLLSVFWIQLAEETCGKIMLVILSLSQFSILLTCNEGWYRCDVKLWLWVPNWGKNSVNSHISGPLIYNVTPLDYSRFYSQGVHSNSHGMYANTVDGLSKVKNYVFDSLLHQNKIKKGVRPPAECVTDEDVADGLLATGGQENGASKKPTRRFGINNKFEPGYDMITCVSLPPN